VEDWTIQNQAEENHEFHMHQIHFLLLAVNGVPVKPDQQQLYDGKSIYMRSCASCHGRKLQGQSLSHPLIGWLSVPANKKSSLVPGFSVLIRC
jgi:cytochrome c5